MPNARFWTSVLQLTMALGLGLSIWLARKQDRRG